MDESFPRISVFGLGYVGCVSAGCLARDGYQVVGVDCATEKVDLVNAGRSPLVEPALPGIIENAVRGGRLRATADSAEAIAASDLSFVCVGTPATSDDRLDSDAVERVCEQIGAALRGHQPRHTVVVRSTLPPGATEELVIPVLESCSGKRAGRDFGVCYHPEFLRESSAVHDFTDPARVVIGELDAQSGAPLARLYRNAPLPVLRTSLRAAEMIKLVDNALHALKVSFANEMGALCKAAGINSLQVMAAVAQDARGGRAPTYLIPGFAFGGSCLPKDLRALASFAARQGQQGLLLRAVADSNERHKQTALEMIRRSGRRRVGVLGLAFKAGTDDLRDSPAVELVACLVREGYAVAVYDRHVATQHLQGANRRYAEHALPTLAALQRGSVAEVLAESDLVVIAQDDAHFQTVLDQLSAGQMVIDLVRIQDDSDGLGSRYQGICW